MTDAAEMTGETGGGRTTGRARDRFARMHDAIRGRIGLLDDAPGTRLSEEVLAAEFGVSLTPLRRVFARLQAEGLWEAVRGALPSRAGLGRCGRWVRLAAVLQEAADDGAGPKGDAGPRSGAGDFVLESAGDLARLRAR